MVALALAAVYLLWGGTYLGNKVALESIPPLLLTSSRFLTAGALLLGAAAVLGRPVWPGVRQARSAALVGLFLVGAGSSLLALGQQRVDSGLASLLIASMPLWALAIGLLLGSRPSGTAAGGIVAGFVGLLLLVGASAVTATATTGVLILLASTLTWATGSTLAQRLRLPEDPLVSSGWQMLVGGGVVSLLAVAVGEAAHLDTLAISQRSALAWLGLTMLCTAIGFSAYAWLLQNTSLRLATTYAYVNPVVAVVLGSVVLGERLTQAQAPGALLILGAVALVVAAERGAMPPTDAALPLPDAALPVPGEGGPASARRDGVVQANIADSAVPSCAGRTP